MLGKLSSDNDQGEEYLTDVVGLLVSGGYPVAAYQAPDPIEVLGCNDRAELAILRRPFATGSTWPGCAPA